MAPLSSAPRSGFRRSRKLLLLVLGLALAGAGAGVWFHYRNRVRPVTVTVEPAALRTIIQTVSATGKIQPEVEVKISPEVAGEIIELPFREGASVKKGDLLVRIKPDNYQAQVEQQEASLADARARHLQTQAQLLKSEADFRRATDLFRKGLISDADHLAAKTDLDIARTSVDAAAANIRRTEGTLRQSRDLLEKTTVYSPLDGTVSSLTSELGERVVATGQFAGTEIMRIANLDQMEVRVQVNENDVVNVKIGDLARITIDAWPRRRFSGIVKEIASTARTTGANTQEEVTNFEVRVRIADRDVPLRPGMSASADIETRTATGVVSVPIQSVAVRSRQSGQTLDELAAARETAAQANAGDSNGSGALRAATAVNEKQRQTLEQADHDSLQRVVFVVRGNTVKQVPVETGISNTTHMEIRTGVAVGDRVVSGSYSAITRTLKDGSLVETERASNPTP
ncbi:RND family efflux transporter, MFP subunit [Opitutaceae bacterium TAV1]|nr:RND family efflux transporter, MFP subunit [Opitutaceae bacterium TAV1]